MPADTEAVTGARRVAGTVLALIAVMVMVGTGVAWGKIRSFEDGIFHMSTAALGGGGQDGAIDILLVGMDSRTDAHGNPLSEDELAALHAGDDVSTNTDTIILVRIPNNGKSATAISVPRDSYVKAPGLDKTKINGVYGHNDELAIAAIQAVTAAGLKAGSGPTDVKVVGVDATADGFKYLITGELGADIECNPLLAPQVYKAALDGLNGVTGQPAWVPSQEGQFFAAQGAAPLQAILDTRKY